MESVKEMHIEIAIELGFLNKRKGELNEG